MLSPARFRRTPWSLSLRRAWIEIRHWPTCRTRGCSRSPYGERGLKFSSGTTNHEKTLKSLSLRRAWIEMTRSPSTGSPTSSLSLRRAWIEISMTTSSRESGTGRSPYGERGLKSVINEMTQQTNPSLSLRRAWIEIGTCGTSGAISSSRSPYGERGLKCVVVCCCAHAEDVALLTESVD